MAFLSKFGIAYLECHNSSPSIDNFSGSRNKFITNITICRDISNEYRNIFDVASINLADFAATSIKPFSDIFLCELYGCSDYLAHHDHT